MTTARSFTASNGNPTIPSPTHTRSVIFAILLIGCLSAAGQSHTQALTKLPFPYSPINSSSLHWMIAKDAGIFEKYGLDVDMVFMGASSLILQSMLSGAANFAGFADASRSRRSPI